MSVNAIINQLDLGDHVCAPLGGPEEGWAVAVQNARCGLRDRHKVLFSADDGPGLHRVLTEELPEARDAIRRGQIQIGPATARYLPRGAIDPEQMLEALATAGELAQREGYAGVRVTGNLSCSFGPGVDHEALLDYELRANSLCAKGKIMGICHYDPQVFAPEVWRRLIAAHPTTLLPTGDGSVARLRGLRTARGVRLSGESDLTNQSVLPRLLDDLVSLPGTCCVDAAGLDFADARTLGHLLHLAVARRRGATVIECQPHIAETLALLGSPSISTLTVTVVDRP